VRRYPCGLIVNVYAYRQQAQCFWREILKQLMHSMGMSMVREKAVANFIERIARIDVKAIPFGWLELRKGFHTYLTDKGDLMILRDGVLRKNLVILNPATTRNQMNQSAKKKKAKDSFNVEDGKDSQSQEPVQSKQESLVVSTEGLTSLLASNAVAEKVTKISASVKVTEREVSSLELNYSIDQVAAVVAVDFQGSNANQAHAAAAARASGLSDVFRYGPWQIIIAAKYVTTATTTPASLIETGLVPPKKVKLFPKLDDILPGDFSYQLALPCIPEPDNGPVAVDFMLARDLTAIVEKEYMFHFNTNLVFDELSSPFPELVESLHCDLKNIDLRYRDGLPFVVLHPRSVLDAKRRVSEASSAGFIVFEVKYEYVVLNSKFGSSAH
jgi:hypothetical protein